MRAALLLAALVALAPAGARAQGAEDEVEAPEPSGPWADVFTPAVGGLTVRDARRLVRDGLGFLLLGVSAGRGPVMGEDVPHVNLERALERFERARRLLPRDRERAYYTAIALSRWESPGPDGGTEYRTLEAIAAWRRVRAIDPGFMADRVAAELAGLHARRAEHALAAAEYERALALHVPEAMRVIGVTYAANRYEAYLAGIFYEASVPLIHGNLAENYMLTGRLDDAVEHYRAAHDQSDRAQPRALAEWGIALAYHRRRDRAAALGAARRAIESDPADDPSLRERWGRFAVLHGDGVFFEPAYEMHGYHAVGYEAYAEERPSHRASYLADALREWRAFLAEGGTSSRFAGHARAQVERLERAVEEAEGDAPDPENPFGHGRPERRRGGLLPEHL